MKAHFFLASWLSARLLFDLEIGRLALFRPRPLARIIRILRQRRELPPSYWVAERHYLTCLTLHKKRRNVVIRKIPLPSSN